MALEDAPALLLPEVPVVCCPAGEVRQLLLPPEDFGGEVLEGAFTRRDDKLTYLQVAVATRCTPEFLELGDEDSVFAHHAMLEPPRCIAFVHVKDGDGAPVAPFSVWAAPRCDNMQAELHEQLVFFVAVVTRTAPRPMLNLVNIGWRLTRDDGEEEEPGTPFHERYVLVQNWSEALIDLKNCKKKMAQVMITALQTLHYIQRRCIGVAAVLPELYAGLEQAAPNAAEVRACYTEPSYSMDAFKGIAKLLHDKPNPELVPELVTDGCYSVDN